MSQKYKTQRQKLWWHRKNKGKYDSSYVPGAFSSHVTPKKKISETEISFIHDGSVKLVVTNNLTNKISISGSFNATFFAYTFFKQLSC